MPVKKLARKTPVSGGTRRAAPAKATRLPPFSHPENGPRNLTTNNSKPGPRHPKLPTNLSLSACAASGPKLPPPPNTPATPSCSMRSISRKKPRPWPSSRPPRPRRPSTRHRTPATSPSKLATRNSKLLSPNPPRPWNPCAPRKTSATGSLPWPTATAGITPPNTSPTAAGRKTSATPEISGEA